MGRTNLGVLMAAPLVVAGSAYPVAADNIYHYNYTLTSEALVMIPAFNQQWLDLANKLYLEPNGFDGTPTFLQVPETSDLNASLSGVVGNLVDAVESDWNNHSFSVDDPLYIFGYSQAAVGAGMAEQQLATYGIPTDALHFVLVGDSASGDGGFLNEFMGTLNQFFPESWAESVDSLVRQIATWLNINSALGVTTPDDLYPTDVYTLTGDGFANWDNGANMPGMFWDHLAYLGLTPEEIGSATETTENLTHYFTIDSADVGMRQALMNSFDMIVSPFI